MKSRCGLYPECDTCLNLEHDQFQCDSCEEGSCFQPMTDAADDGFDLFDLLRDR